MKPHKVILETDTEAQEAAIREESAQRDLDRMVQIIAAYHNLKTEMDMCPTDIAFDAFQLLSAAKEKLGLGPVCTMEAEGE